MIGIGINVLPQPVADAASGFACWSELDSDANVAGALERVAVALAPALRRFERDGFAAFAAGFEARDLLRGQLVVTSPPDAVEGICDGVSARGALRVRAAAGVRSIESGEVSVRLAEPAGGGAGSVATRDEAAHAGAAPALADAAGDGVGPVSTTPC